MLTVCHLLGRLSGQFPNYKLVYTLQQSKRNGNMSHVKESNDQYCVVFISYIVNDIVNT